MCTALRGPFSILHSILQLTSHFSQKATCPQALVSQKEETTSDAGHAAATEEVDTGHRRDMQGGPSGRAPAEPPAGAVSAAAGTYDEPTGEDDPACVHHVNIIREAMKFRSYCIFFSRDHLAKAKKHNVTDFSLTLNFFKLVAYVKA